MSSKTMAEKENSSSEPPSLIPSLPEDVIIDILARASRWEYPTLSLVSKQFRSLLASPEIYTRRSLLGCTEHCPYIVLYEDVCNLRRWYILSRKANGNRSLVHIPSLPPLTRDESFVAVGSKIYVFGGTNETSAYSIDCRFQTVQPLPSMPLHMSYTMAAIIEEKIYVMGCLDESKNFIVLFNTKTNMWEPDILDPDTDLYGERQRLDDCLLGGWVVLANKMYVKHNPCCLVYDPEENIWTPDYMLRSVKMPTACVIDDMLYYFPVFDHTDDDYFVAKNITTYDPKRRCWGVVKGLEKLFSMMKDLWCMHTANYSGKLALFYSKEVNSNREIWCVEISLERRHGGGIWGTVEWCGQVLVAEDFRKVMKCLNVMV